MGRPLSQCAGEMRGFQERAEYMIAKSEEALKNVISKTYDYIKGRGPKPFEYHINLEIKNELTPEVWLKKEL